MAEAIFRQLGIAEGKKYGCVGFAREEGEEVMRLTTYKPGEILHIDVPLAAIPRFIELMAHAYNTKTREHEDETYVFPHLKED